MNQKLAPIVDYLSSISERADLEVLGKLLRGSQLEPSDVTNYCHFHDLHYARNKVAGNDWFDLYIMCWKPGQASTIHDHAGSSCALRIIQGTASEQGYDRLGPESKYVRPTGITSYQNGEVCLAQDGQIHKIYNASATENLVTMHIYSPPLKMNVYEEVGRADITAVNF